MSDITVITPSLPSRSAMLAEACNSVAGQDLLPEAHLIGIDYEHRGPAYIRNTLIAAATTKWIAFLDDDDVLDPTHLATLKDNTYGNYAPDVVGSYCRFTDQTIPDKFCNRPFDRKALAKHGIFPITVLARRTAVIDAGWFNPADRYEDWSMWNRMADNGARFHIIPRVTWTYRLGHGNRTHGTAA